MNNKYLAQYTKKIFRSFFLLIGIPIFILTVYHISNINRQHFKQEYQYNHMEISREVKWTDSFLEKSSEILEVISRSPELKKMQNEDYRDCVYSYGQVLSMLRSFEATDLSDSMEFGLYIARSQRVLSSFHTMDTMDTYRDADLIRRFLEEKVRVAFYTSGNQLVVCATQPKYYYDDSTVFLFYLDLNSVLNLTEEESGYILLPNGESLSGKFAPEGLDQLLRNEIPENQAEIGYCKYKGHNIWYQVDKPSQIVIAHVTARNANVRAVTYTVLAAVCLIVLSFGAVAAVSYFMTVRYSRPVKKLSEQLEQLSVVDLQEETDDDGNAIFSAISESMASLQSQNEEYRQSVAQNRKTMRDSVIRNLMWNKVSIHCSVSDYLIEKKFSNVTKLVEPLLVKIGPSLKNAQLDRIAEMNSLVMEMLTEYLKDEILIGSCQMETDQFVFLLGISEEEQENQLTYEALENCADIIREKIGIQVKLMLGYPVEMAEDLCREFIDMRRQVYLHSADTGVMCIKKSKSSRSHLSPYLRNTLMDAIRSGNADEMVKTVDYIYETAQKEPNPLVAHNYLFAIFGNILSHLYDLPVDLTDEQLNFLIAFNSETDMQQQKDLLTSKLMQITEKFGTDHAEETSSDYVLQAKEFIGENFSRDISIAEIAQHVGVNVSYFSRIFKEDTKQSPLQYITQLRIEKAKELLATEALTIREIAEKVGYNDTRSLVRFFKKNEGVSPSEFRTRYQKNKSLLD